MPGGRGRRTPVPRARHATTRGTRADARRTWRTPPRGIARSWSAARRGPPAPPAPDRHPCGLRSMIERFLEVGFSKFVVRPLESPGSWRAELEALASAVLDLQA